MKTVVGLALCLALTHQEDPPTTSDGTSRVEGQAVSWRNFPLITLLGYQTLIIKAEGERPDCIQAHKESYEELKNNLETHWADCLKANRADNASLWLQCLNERAGEDKHTLSSNILQLAECIQGEEVMSEAEWARQVEDMRYNLPVVKKINEFYVAVENARLANRTACVQEFEPKVKDYTFAVDSAIESCQKFVPRAHLDEWLQCCEDLAQPVCSDIDSKLLFISSCGI